MLCAAVGVAVSSTTEKRNCSQKPYTLATPKRKWKRLWKAANLQIEQRKVKYDVGWYVQIYDKNRLTLAVLQNRVAVATERDSTGINCSSSSAEIRASAYLLIINDWLMMPWVHFEISSRLSFERCSCQEHSCSLSSRWKNKRKSQFLIESYWLLLTSQQQATSLLQPVHLIHVKLVATHILSQRATWTAATCLFSNSRPCAQFIISLAHSLPQLSFINWAFYVLWQWKNIHLKLFCCFKTWVLFL